PRHLVFARWQRPLRGPAEVAPGDVIPARGHVHERPAAAPPPAAPAEIDRLPSRQVADEYVTPVPGRRARAVEGELHVEPAGLAVRVLQSEGRRDRLARAEPRPRHVNGDGQTGDPPVFPGGGGAECGEPELLQVGPGEEAIGP